jgi:hypothetical protein
VVVERLARTGKAGVGERSDGVAMASPRLRPCGPDVDLVVLGGKWVIDQVWCPRPFDLLRPVTDPDFVDEQSLLAAT